MILWHNVIAVLAAGSSVTVVPELYHVRADFNQSQHKTPTHCTTQQRQLPLTQRP